MSTPLEDKERRIVPRWRDYASSIRELNSVSTAAPSPISGNALISEKRMTWEAERTIESAADLVSAVFVAGDPESATDAAQFLLRDSTDATPSVKSLAAVLTSGTVEADDSVLDGSADLWSDVSSERLKARAIKAQLRRFPRNPLVWADLSRSYALLGQSSSSVHAMQSALYLSSTNRFVLRSAARLFVHIREPDRAHAILTASARTQYDPWLMAAEIAVAAVAERPPIYASKGRRLLRSGAFAPFQTAELASALATLELDSGSIRSSKKLFAASLQNPTENAVAQAHWASRNVPGFSFNTHALDTPRAFEARAWNSLRELRWVESIQEAGRWLVDEPYSKRPAQFGSYVATIGLEDYVMCEQFARRGLVSNPNDPSLTNNLAFAFANRGSLREATDRIRSVPRPQQDANTECALLATQGLILFREGQAERGRTHYEAAIKLAERRSLSKTRVLASIYLAREEVRASTPHAEEAVNLAMAFGRREADPEISWVLRNLVDALVKTTSGAAPISWKG